ncbi:MAG: hypothetical protein AAF636_13950 [Pseudomonadota bacterium]
MEITISKVDTSYVVTIPNNGNSAAFSVGFSDLKDAQDLAVACAGWFADCRYTTRKLYLE